MSLSYWVGIFHVALVLASGFPGARGLNKSVGGDLGPVAVEVSGMMTFSMTVSHCVEMLALSSWFPSADGSVKVEGDDLVSVQVSDMMAVSLAVSSCVDLSDVSLIGDLKSARVDRSGKVVCRGLKLIPSMMI